MNVKLKKEKKKLISIFNFFNFIYFKNVLKSKKLNMKIFN